MSQQGTTEQPIVQVWGDLLIDHFIVKEPFDIRSGHPKIADYYIPGGTFVFRSLLESSSLHANTWDDDKPTNKGRAILNTPGSLPSEATIASNARFRVQWQVPLAINQLRSFTDSIPDLDALLRNMATISSITASLSNPDKSSVVPTLQFDTPLDSALSQLLASGPDQPIDAIRHFFEAQSVRALITSFPIAHSLINAFLSIRNLSRETTTLSRMSHTTLGPSGYNHIFREGAHVEPNERVTFHHTKTTDPVEHETRSNCVATNPDKTHFAVAGTPVQPPTTLVNVASVDFDVFGLHENDFAFLRTQATPPTHVIKAKSTFGWNDRAETIAKHLIASIHSPPSTVLVVSADELRREGMRISYRVSWERTIQTLMRSLRTRHPHTTSSQTLIDLVHKPCHTIITFGCDAAVYLIRDSDRPAFVRAYFVVDPAVTEGDYVERHGPRVRGFDTVITCAIAHAFAIRQPVVSDPAAFEDTCLSGLTRGLKAARFLQRHGFEQIPPSSIIELFVDDVGICAPWQYCRFIIDYVGRLLVDTKYRMLEHRVMFPYDLLAAIIADGSPKRLSWYPVAATPGKTEQRRRVGERIQSEWTDCGWFRCHFFDKDAVDKLQNDMPGGPEGPPIQASGTLDFNSQVKRKVAEYSADLPYFDQHWWSLLEWTIADEPKARPISDSLRRRRLVNFADIVLRHGYAWLRGDPSAAVTIRRDYYSHYLSQEKGSVALPALSRGAPMISESRLSLESNSTFDDVFKAVDAERRRYPHLPDYFGVIPVTMIGDYFTVDRREAENMRGIVQIIRSYLFGEMRRPLSIGVFGPPGAGKNFLINEVCKQIKADQGGGSSHEFYPMTFNLSQFSDPHLLTEAFDEIQDVGLNHKLPVVFWDEFDSPLRGMPLGWLSFFLGPMNDGQYFRRERTRRLPASIFVFAGSLFTSYLSVSVLHRMSTDGILQVFVNRFTPAEWQAAKGPDFKSRLTGTLDVLGVNPLSAVRIFRQGIDSPSDFITSIGGNGSEFISQDIRDPYSYFVRRALVLRKQLWDKNRDVFDGNEPDSAYLRIDKKVARAFLEIGEYAHGARSIEQIISMSAFDGRPVYGPREIPTAAQLRVHVNAKEFERFYAKELWEPPTANLVDLEDG